MSGLRRSTLRTTLSPQHKETPGGYDETPPRLRERTESSSCVSARLPQLLAQCSAGPKLDSPGREIRSSYGQLSCHPDVQQVLKPH